MEKVSVNGVQVSPDDGIGSPQRSSSVDSLKVESPGGSTRKGFGLKKWRRIKRDTPVKDESAAPVDDGSKLLKRNLTGLVNPPSKHVDLSSVEARQGSEGSVGSVNMMAHHHHHHLPSVVNGFSPGPGLFNVGQGFEKSEEHSGGGKIDSGSQGRDTIKNGSEERIDSDLRSSDFVFSSGAVSAANRIADGQEARELVETYSRSENGGEGGDESHKKKNNHYQADKDHVADSIRCLAALQEALWKEVTSFQELSKESIPPLHSSTDEVDSGSQVLILKQKVKHLQHKFEEARADLDTKEARIQELENAKIEAELEGVFQRKIEAEIQHLMLRSSLNSTLLKEHPKKVHSVAEDPEPNRGNMLGKTCKSSFYFLIQLILLVSIVRLLLLQSSPASQLVIPT
ncbi:unnamed protein product [Brassica rapa subsp. narinosa]